jgi:hypothetical protein
MLAPGIEGREASRAAPSHGAACKHGRISLQILAGADDDVDTKDDVQLEYPLV